MGRDSSDPKRGERPEPVADVDRDGPPTIIPTFDFQKFVAETEMREPSPTLVDDEALEQARIASIPSNAPPAKRPSRGAAKFSSGPPSPDSTVSGAEDGTIEIDSDEADISILDDDEQVAILKSNLAPLSRVPFLAKKLNELGDVLGDPKSAYVLGFIDGVLPLETIIEVTGLPELDTLRVIDKMVEHGVVVFRKRS